MHHITKNSLEEQFNVGKKDETQLKIGSKHIDAYPFTYNIVKKFKKNLTLYLKHHKPFLNPETVLASLVINRNGDVSFSSFITSSEKQPKMNYLIESSINNIIKLSKEEMNSYPMKYEQVSLPIFLSFQGPPLYLFSFGIGNW